jgi:hypothetical protein
MPRERHRRYQIFRTRPCLAAPYPCFCQLKRGQGGLAPRPGGVRDCTACGREAPCRPFPRYWKRRVEIPSQDDMAANGEGRQQPGSADVALYKDFQFGTRKKSPGGNNFPLTSESLMLS